MPIGTFMVNPILIINLGSEMVYIIDQRLKAQQISYEKSKHIYESRLNGFERLNNNSLLHAVSANTLQTCKNLHSKLHKEAV